MSETTAADLLCVRVLHAAARLARRGEPSVYEVDVLIECQPLSPLRAHQAFRACVERGWLTPSPGEPDAFLVAHRVGARRDRRRSRANAPVGTAR